MSNDLLKRIDEAVRFSRAMVGREESGSAVALLLEARAEITSLRALADRLCGADDDEAANDD